MNYQKYTLLSIENPFMIKTSSVPIYMKYSTIFKFRARMSDIAKDAVFVATGEFPEPNPDKVEGYDFENGCDYDKLFA